MIGASLLLLALSAVLILSFRFRPSFRPSIMSDEPDSKSAPVVEITEGLEIGHIGIVRLDNLSLKMRQPCMTARSVCGDWKPSRGPSSFHPAASERAFFSSNAGNF